MLQFLTKRLNCWSQWNSHYKYLKRSVASQIGPLVLTNLRWSDDLWRQRCAMMPLWRYLSYPEPPSFLFRLLQLDTTQQDIAYYLTGIYRRWILLRSVNLFACGYWLFIRFRFTWQVKLKSSKLRMFSRFWKQTSFSDRICAFVSWHITHILCTCIASFPQRVTRRIPIRLQDLNGHLQQGSELYNISFLCVLSQNAI